MKVKKRKNVTTKETCAFLGCFLFVFFTISQILVMSHRSSSINATGEKEKPRKARELASVSPNLFVQAKNNKNSAWSQRKNPFHLASGQNPDHLLRMKKRARLQSELRRMEKSLTQLVRQNSMPPEDASAHFQTEVSVIQMKEMIRKSEEGLVTPFYGNRTHSRRRRLFEHVNRTQSLEEGELGSDDAAFNETSLSADRRDDVDDQLMPSSLVHDLGGGGGGFSHERGPKGRGVLNDSPPAAAAGKAAVAAFHLAHHLQDFDRSEEYDLERTVMKSLEGGDGNGGGSEADGHENDDDNDDEIDPSVVTPRWDVDRQDLLGEVQDGMIQVCKEIPDGLVGQIPNVQLEINVDIAEIIKTNADIKEGEWKPADCISRHRLAIIIPYRDRWSHLKVLLHYLLPVLKRQQIHFRVFVVEQYGNQTFNKGRIMNAAFREAMKMFNFQCVIFHDVDLVPEDDRNMYTCAEHPKHMSTAIDKFSYRLPYQGLVGGVLSFRAEHFQAVNGYSNMYWGWGGEDDDMTVRILHRGLRIFRPPSNVARYKMVKHGSRQLSELRLKLLRTAARRSRVEGLNNVPYKLMFIHMEKLFTHFMVDVGKP